MPEERPGQEGHPGGDARDRLGTDFLTKDRQGCATGRKVRAQVEVLEERPGQEGLPVGDARGLWGTALLTEDQRGQQRVELLEALTDMHMQRHGG